MSYDVHIPRCARTRVTMEGTGSQIPRFTDEGAWPRLWV
jgi:hypothetical protein